MEVLPATMRFRSVSRALLPALLGILLLGGVGPVAAIPRAWRRSATYLLVVGGAGSLSLLLVYWAERVRRPGPREPAPSRSHIRALLDRSSAWFAHDVTDRVEAERRLLFDLAHDARVAIDGQGRIALFNREAERLFQRPSADALGRPAEILIPERCRAAYRAARTAWVNSNGERGTVLRSKVHCLRADGSEVPVEINLAPVGQDGGVRILAALRDVSDRVREASEREQLESQLRHAQKLESLGVLAGGIAHDFNNLLAAVVNYANLSLLRVDAASPARRDIARIKLAAQRMGELTSLMLAYSGRAAAALQPIDLNAEIRELRALLTSVISKKAIVTYGLCAEPPLLRADRAQIQQIIFNLVTNASEALVGEPGRIRIRTGRLGDRDAPRLEGLRWRGDLPGRAAYLEVSDAGKGMDPRTAERIFEPFFTTKRRGRGLGLAAVLGIVQKRGGAIGVESQVGRGTRVVVVLPLPEEELAPATQPQVAAQIAGARVLVVDDESPVRESARLFLEARGATVFACSDGASTIRFLRRSGRAFDVALLDLTMPDMDGGELLREIRRMRPSVPVALCSGYEVDAMEAVPAPDARVFCVRKPYELEAVMARLLDLVPVDGEEAIRA